MGFFDFLNFKKKLGVKQKFVLIRSESEWERDGFDPLFEKMSRAIVIQSTTVFHKDSARAFIQREFRLGYSRAGRIIDQLEQSNIIEIKDAQKNYKIVVNDQNNLTKLLEGLGKLSSLCRHPNEYQFIFHNKEYYHISKNLTPCEITNIEKERAELYLETAGIKVDSAAADLSSKYTEEDYILYCFLCKSHKVVENIDLTDVQATYFNSIGTEDSCYLYLMKDFNTGYYKIGISNSPEYREKTLQSEKPTIEMISNKKYISRKIAHSFEQALHKTFSNKRVRGEWFDLNQRDVKEIEFTLNS